MLDASEDITDLALDSPNELFFARLWLIYTLNFVASGTKLLLVLLQDKKTIGYEDRSLHASTIAASPCNTDVKG